MDCFLLPSSGFLLFVYIRLRPESYTVRNFSNFLLLILDSENYHKKTLFNANILDCFHRDGNLASRPCQDGALTALSRPRHQFLEPAL